MPLYGIGYFVHIACFCCGEKISALGRETEIIHVSAMPSCARREVGRFGERQPGTRLSLLTPAL